MNEASFSWHYSLGRWQEEWVPRADADEDDEGGRSVELPGRPGADESTIAATEERLVRRLPPSSRAFLAVSDGWHVDQTAGVYRLGGEASAFGSKTRR